MPPRRTVWSIEAHTRGKHRVLREYMKAWLPILGQTNGRVLFVDGFAGPGVYADGEEGSPIIALNTLTNHAARNRISANVLYLFIEERKDRASHLQMVLEQLAAEIPPNCTYEVVTGRFDDTIQKVLTSFDENMAAVPPCFVMIDPFGVAGIPMSTIEQILTNSKSEVYVTVMYDPINRWKDHPYFERHLDESFGTQKWRDGIGISGY